MLPRSGSLSQQWTVKKVNGGYEPTNGLFGMGTKLTIEGDWVAIMKSEGSGV